MILLPLNLLLPTEKSLACSCMIPENAQVAKKEAAAVFTGTVREIKEFKVSRNEAYFAATLVVDESWKGVNEPEVVVYTGWSSCQFDFEKSGRYLLYPYDHDGRYEVTNCGRSGEISQENVRTVADLEELGAGTKFEAPPQTEEADEGTGKAIRWVGIFAALLLLAAVFGLWQRRKRNKKA
ncbi:hypothetical protein [Saccharibacillus qingshengii]|uniref:hypothetical protein n=1 Tax=Saccharibacillus qingshengii TaxID=1763540 RepID=UPI0015530F28|nr:hypothetical protein [Saccharibacillus qingshengii]